MRLADLPGRDHARELAERELSRRAYAQAKPSLLLRAVRAVIDKVEHTFNDAAASLPAGAVGLVFLLSLVAILIALVVLRLRPVTVGVSFDEQLFGDQVLTARGHRELAERHAAAGEYADAVRERLRAVVRELESRGVLDPRPGRTADEVAREAGSAVPGIAEPLQRGVTVFDDVWYGGRTADRAAYEVLLDVDRTVTDARLVRA